MTYSVIEISHFSVLDVQ